jgi:hypothetical protein
MGSLIFAVRECFLTATCGSECGNYSTLGDKDGCHIVLETVSIIWRSVLDVSLKLYNACSSTVC